MNPLAQNAISWTEAGLVPDAAIRAGIRRLTARRAREVHARDAERAATELDAFVREMRESDIALLPERANEQHYEVPPRFFAEVLGHRRKYSCCYWPEGIDRLDDAEDAALAASCERAGIEDGMKVLDLGCGWGSLSLWIAERYPASHVTAVSNSHAQRSAIEDEARRRDIGNLQVITADMNDFQAPGTYDRVVSVEMFEHMRNWARLFARVAGWLEPGGRFFMHVFCHRHVAYPFVDRGPSDWMSRHFFSGGLMPSADLPLRFPAHLRVERQWLWDGRHYEKTANAWLRRMDGRREAVMPIMRETYGDDRASAWWMRWRMFFMACAETFAWNDGQEWLVGHYLLRRTGDA